MSPKKRNAILLSCLIVILGCIIYGNFCQMSQGYNHCLTYREKFRIWCWPGPLVIVGMIAFVFFQPKDR